MNGIDVFPDGGGGPTTANHITYTNYQSTYFSVLYHNQTTSTQFLLESLLTTPQEVVIVASSYSSSVLFGTIPKVLYIIGPWWYTQSCQTKRVGQTNPICTRQWPHQVFWLAFFPPEIIELEVKTASSVIFRYLTKSFNVTSIYNKSRNWIKNKIYTYAIAPKKKNNK